MCALLTFTNARFLVLEHGTLLVYASEDEWAEHREPLDDVPLCADATVETSLEGGEVSPTGCTPFCAGNTSSGRSR